MKSILFSLLLSTDALADTATHVKYLASEELEGRGTGQPGNAKAQAYLKEQLEASGYKVTLQAFSANGRQTANVVGVLEPNGVDEYVVIGAHFDHLGRSGNRIYYGADDNASGTAAMLEVAKELSQSKTRKRGIIAIGFSGEEMGLLGSKFYVRNPVVPLQKTKHMLNLDMVGYLRNGRLSASGGNAALSELLERLDASFEGLGVRYSSSAGSRSDHAPFINARIPAVFFHTGEHSCYHKTCDTATHPAFNYKGLADIATFATAYACYLIENDVTSFVSDALIADVQEHLAWKPE